VLIFAGSGQLEEQLRAYAAQFSIPDVVFLGFRSRTDLSEAYSAADIFALTSSYRETWGTVVNEAMSFGLPIVLTSQVGCAPDLVAEGANGYVVRDGDEDALTAQLNRLVVDPVLRHRMGVRSAEIIQQWNHSIAANGVLQAISAAVGPQRWASAQPVLSDILTNNATQ
jgi:glycosyltransferase involved in cell wall biosynthesis